MEFIQNGHRLAKPIRYEQEISFFHSDVMSTINLTFYETIAGRPTPGFFTNLGGSLRTGWNNVLDVALDMIAAWPAWLPVMAVFFAGRRIYKRLKKDKTVTA